MAASGWIPGGNSPDAAENPRGARLRSDLYAFAAPHIDRVGARTEPDARADILSRMLAADVNRDGHDDALVVTLSRVNLSRASRRVDVRAGRVGVRRRPFGVPSRRGRRDHPAQERDAPEEARDEDRREGPRPQGDALTERPCRRRPSPKHPAARRGSIALGVAAMLSAAPARANGRFPAASHVVLGQGPSARAIVLRATFGLLLSDDDGAHFRWVCEERALWPLVPETGYDPPVELHRDGATLVGSPRGLNRLRGACELASTLTLRGREVIDLAVDETRATVFALTRDVSGARVLRSDDGGESFTGVGDALPDAELNTLDVAPSNPARIYTAGRFRDSGRARFDRSDDGGRTWTTSSPAVPDVTDLWLSGVSPADPDTVFVRAPRGLGTALLRSRDGGRSFAEVAATQGPMLGFARSDDGATVWYGSAAEGLWRSDDGGARFARVSTTPVLCLRAQGPWLYACSDGAATGWALARSQDRGQTFTALVRFGDITGPASCPPSEPQTACEDRWITLAPQLAAARTDAGAPAPDATTARPPTPHTATGCGCATAPITGSVGSLGSLISMLFALRRRRPRGDWPRSSALT